MSGFLANFSRPRQALFQFFGRLLLLRRGTYASSDSARRIGIIGGDVAEGVTAFLRWNLTIIGLSPHVAETPGHVAHFVHSLGPGDLVIAVTFRKGLRQVIEGVRDAKAAGAYCVGITDTHVSPLTRFADEYFITSTESPSFGSSLVAPVAFVNLLMVACGSYRPARTLRFLKKAEKEQRTGFRWY
jgi:RpiR family carbohydrate utilization transcriptional regulator